MYKVTKDRFGGMSGMVITKEQLEERLNKNKEVK